jgi:adenine-specific DNA-methyltransferase
MTRLNSTSFPVRYQNVGVKKAGGVTYTPKGLADFVADKMVQAFSEQPQKEPPRVLDPAVGDGALLISLLNALTVRKIIPSEVVGFDVNTSALSEAKRKINASFPAVDLDIRRENFLDFILKTVGVDSQRTLFAYDTSFDFDLIIANPPYVRTQVLGANSAQGLSRAFGLSGRVDLYYAFIIGMAQVLGRKGIAGIIVSNRFMTTKSGAAIRKEILSRFNLLHVWDLGDTKVFDAAVLPAVLLAGGRDLTLHRKTFFTSIYETDNTDTYESPSIFKSLNQTGKFRVPDDRSFHVRHGLLYGNGREDGIWRIAESATDGCLQLVSNNTWAIFRDVGSIHVGVKTCADKVFVRSDWLSFSDKERPELLRPLTTHHIADRFRSTEDLPSRFILYPHVSDNGKRVAVDLSKYPKSMRYLNSWRSVLESRRYVIESGKKWYEIWVPQDPAAWDNPKLVFRDISNKPTFWLDLKGTIVNGDCYWMISKGNREDILWLACAVCNSTFAEWFYDSMFHNKLYAGRRRFMAQYVEQFPLPDPGSEIAREIIEYSKRIYMDRPQIDTKEKEAKTDELVWRSFGLRKEEVCR